jgi:hypothetical protein
LRLLKAQLVRSLCMPRRQDRPASQINSQTNGRSMMRRSAVKVVKF